MTELWKSLKDIVEYGDYYEVSNFGNVRSIDKRVTLWNSPNGKIIKGRILKTQLDRDGYVRVTLNHNREKCFYQVHRLVALAWIPNPDNKPTVNHKDGKDKTNNHVDNLEWSTRKEQSVHAVKTGLLKGKSGESSPVSKLTDDIVIEIFNKYKTGSYTMKELSEEYLVAQSTIHTIVRGTRWKHLGLVE